MGDSAAQERRAAMREITDRLVDLRFCIDNPSREQVLDKLCDALDLYIARSTQGWCR